MTNTHTNFDMLVSPVDEPLINLITEAQSVMFNAEVCDHLQLIFGENLQEEDRKEIVRKTVIVSVAFSNTVTDNSCVLTFPMGLLGVLMMMAFVLELNLPASSSGSRNQSALVIVFFPDF